MGVRVHESRLFAEEPVWKSACNRDARRAKYVDNGRQIKRVDNQVTRTGMWIDRLEN